MSFDRTFEVGFSVIMSDVVWEYGFILGDFENGGLINVIDGGISFKWIIWIVQELTPHHGNFVPALYFELKSIFLTSHQTVLHLSRQFI
jgi:hypothetical protein